MRKLEFGKQRAFRLSRGGRGAGRSWIYFHDLLHPKCMLHVDVSEVHKEKREPK